MTDEELIEKAARAAYAAVYGYESQAFDPGEGHDEDWRAIARSVLAVFREHTDDERCTSRAWGGLRCERPTHDDREHRVTFEAEDEDGNDGVVWYDPKPAEPTDDEPLIKRPAVGTRVRLIRSDFMLRERHGADVGSIGVVTSHSHLAPDDDGVLVQWERGGDIRCNLSELALAPAEPAVTKHMVEDAINAWIEAALSTERGEGDD